MRTKLALKLGSQLVRAAKQMVLDHFAAIACAKSSPSTLAPKVSRLVGALEGAGVDETDYHAHLERKYL